MVDWVREEHVKALMGWQSEKELIENPGLFLEWKIMLTPMVSRQVVVVRLGVMSG